MTPVTQPKDPFGLVGSVLDGRYRVDGVVAEGGFGVVYRAHHISLDRAVAIKALKLDDGPGRLPEFREHFRAEARTMARLKHEAIADVYDSGFAQRDGREIPWIALEWLEGMTLEAKIQGRRGQGGMGPREALGLLRPALDAFAYAHRNGIAHRDIKPGNLMVTEDALGLHIRVLDFGISKIMSPDEEAGTGRTRTGGTFAFSPGYASPEQISGGRTGPWTDVHALGLVLTELLTDAPPVEGTEIALYSQILGTQRPTPGSKGNNVGPWEAVLARAMALQPNGRWRDAGALLEALEATVAESDKTASAARAALQNAPTSAARPAGMGLAATVSSAELASAPAARPVSTTFSGLPLDTQTLNGAAPSRRARTVALGLFAVAGVATVAVLLLDRGGLSPARFEPATSSAAGSPGALPRPSASPAGSEPGAAVTAPEPERQPAAEPAPAPAQAPSATELDRRSRPKVGLREPAAVEAIKTKSAAIKPSRRTGETGRARGKKDSPGALPETAVEKTEPRRSGDPSELQIR